MHRSLKIFGTLTSIGMVIVLMQGALVTKTESGEGCGATWPLCFGEVIPTNPAIETIIEYSHRIVSGLLGAMVIILAIWAWRKLSHIRETKVMAILAVLFIIFQGLLGAGAVVFGQSHAILALHFGISAISLATVVLLTTLAFEDGKPNPPAPIVKKGYKGYILAVFAYCYAVIYTGAYVKHTQATLACGDFPLCNGQWIPMLSGPVGAHFFHRVAGTLLLILLVVALIWTLRKYSHYRSLVWTHILCVILVLTQYATGISIVLTGNELFVAMMHALIVSILFTTLCYIVMILSRNKAV
ncbi:heme A synthase [Halalkalibacterium halodurans]|jgi:cytochrome c oxidase assembly protein subunit 15|uniref:Heme A synthase n=1 Tax=Halalkalibacterium halodurans TaxID=86665 RepID=A0A0M0KIH7_ALKHA|nr:heme A synthase [Halalkalibacterium halodurans]MDY7223151.1 heme A synthase [Halalkalibacterium halodurans]MDY7242372.1 heme A synthase [Halalkalibacterium halodurans]MED3647742.1 heme A synthase [Halalkalibacterium halodurans]MED4079759.1 heme A synthase [Halalkalibacterium halodurans]MED4086299.1 heme A synthase [Halalkalibacterium halodurans]